MVTLPEMIFYGETFCTRYDMYNLYMDLPIVIHKREHAGTYASRKRAMLK